MGNFFERFFLFHISAKTSYLFSSVARFNLQNKFQFMHDLGMTRDVRSVSPSDFKHNFVCLRTWLAAD